MRLALVLLLVAETALAASLAGRANPGATVTATSTMLPQGRSTTTAANGAYVLDELIPGTYDVTFSLRGHQTITKRAEVHAGETTRVDATLEPSADEEMVSSSALLRSLHERPQSVWNIDRATAEALPLGRDVSSWLALAPGERIDAIRIDGTIFTRRNVAIPADALAETSVVFAGASADIPNDLADVTTRGGRDFTASLRETLEWRRGDRRELHEAALGGLWAFGALSVADGGVRNGYARATLAPSARDTAIVSFLGSSRAEDLLGGSWTHTRQRLTANASLSNDYASLRASTFVHGANELAAGLERIEGDLGGFVRNRWHASPRFVVEGGFRYEDDELSPRLGAVFDPRGDGTLRFTAFASDDELAVSGGMSFASAGYARATLVRRDGGYDAAVLDGRFEWLLLTFGASATLGDEHHGAAWLIIDPPIPDHELNIAVMERYTRGFAATDVAINYLWPREGIAPFVEGDVVNVFDRNDGRVFRLSLGVRWR